MGIEIEINSLEDMCDLMCNNLIPRKKVNKINKSDWIPVSKRMPEFGKNVLTQGEDGYMRVDWYSSDNKWFWAEDDAYQPIAWMPLPEPYKE